MRVCGVCVCVCVCVCGGVEHGDGEAVDVEEGQGRDDDGVVEDGAALRGIGLGQMMRTHMGHGHTHETWTGTHEAWAGTYGTWTDTHEINGSNRHI